MIWTPMRTAALLILLAAPCLARTHVSLTPQQHWIGRYQEVVVLIRNEGDKPLMVQPVAVWHAVMALGLDPATRSNLLREQRSLRGMSVRRKALIGFAGAGGLFTILDQADAFKFNESDQWRAIVPTVTTTIALGTAFVRQNVPEDDLDQAELLPVFPFEIPVGGSISFSMYGVMQ